MVSSVNVSPKSLFKKTPIERAPPRGYDKSYARKAEDYRNIKSAFSTSLVLENDPNMVQMQKKNFFTQCQP